MILPLASFSSGCRRAAEAIAAEQAAAEHFAGLRLLGAAPHHRANGAAAEHLAPS